MSEAAYLIIAGLSLLVVVLLYLWRRAVKQARTWKQIADWQFTQTLHYAGLAGEAMRRNAQLEADWADDVAKGDWWKEGRNPEGDS